MKRIKAIVDWYKWAYSGDLLGPTPVLLTLIHLMGIGMIVAIILSIF